MNELDVLDGVEWRRRLDQDQVWIDRRNIPIPIRHMTTKHRDNARRWLKKHAQAILTAVWCDNEHAEADTLPFLGGDPVAIMRDMRLYRALVSIDTDTLSG